MAGKRWLAVFIESGVLSTLLRINRSQSEMDRQRWARHAPDDRWAAPAYFCTGCAAATYDILDSYGDSVCCGEPAVPVYDVWVVTQ